MTIDWESRIAELAAKLAREYTMADRLVLEILLAALIDCPRTPAVWLILETNWYSRDCMDGWFSFGETWLPNSLPRLRSRFPWRMVEEEIQEWLDSPSDPRLFIEPDYDRYPYFHRLTQGSFLLQRSLRVRTRTNRSVDPLAALDTRNEERRKDELTAATDMVLRDRAGLRSADPPVFRQPVDFLYQLETLQRLAPWYLDWGILVKSFASLAIRHAYLFDRRETGAAENLAMARVAADSVPIWIAKAIRLLAQGPARPQTLETAMCLEEKTKRSGHGAHRELVRLRRGGIVRWNMTNMSWSLADAHRDAVISLVEGRGFGTIASCA